MGDLHRPRCFHCCGRGNEFELGKEVMEGKRSDLFLFGMIPWDRCLGVHSGSIRKQAIDRIESAQWERLKSLMEKAKLEIPITP